MKIADYRNRSKAFFLGAAVGLCLFFAILSGPRIARGEPVHVTVAYGALTGAQALPWIAEETGAFKKHGFDVQLVYIAGTSGQIAALLSGSVQFSQATGQGVIHADLSGADVVFLTGNMKTFTWNLMARPGIKKVRDLKGRILGVSRFGSATDFATRFVLRRYKIVPEKDVKLIQVGGMREILAALTGKKIDAGLLSSPQYLVAVDQGFHVLLSLPDLRIPFQGNGLTATKSFINKNPGLVRKFLESYLEAIKYYKTNAKGTISIIKQYTKISDPRALEETYKFYDRLLARVPFPSLKGIQMILGIESKTNPAAKKKRPSEFVADQFLKELEESGFVKRLYASH